MLLYFQDFIHYLHQRTQKIKQDGKRKDLHYNLKVGSLKEVHLQLVMIQQHNNL
jgi:hypothetical protein